jgi:aconitate hydratase
MTQLPTPVRPGTHAFAATLKTFKIAPGKTGRFYSLPELAKQFPKISRLPVSLRIVLESVLRNCDGQKVTAAHVSELANWQAGGARSQEIPFVVSRVVLQDFTGVPLLADLAAMRSVAVRLGKNPELIEPLVPVDLVVDHSIMVDHYGKKNSLDLNMKLEFQRNQERYEFMKWGMQALTPLAWCRRVLASCTRSILNTWRAACTRIKTVCFTPIRSSAPTATPP